MAKSSRSKWKKMHRRQRAQAEATNTVKRIKQLHKKLELTAKGGISAVPPQEPETRFHFLNPELDPRVPNTRKDLNNNYRAELNHVQYDYTKPLRLAPPRTNMYGKTDMDAPHPVTVTFETIDADAPLAGHALTKADMERLAQRQSAQAAAAEEEELAAAVIADVEGDDVGSASDAEDSDGPEEYVFGMSDAAPRRARAGKGASAKKEGAVAPKSKKAAAAAGALTSSVDVSSSRHIAAAAAAAALAAEEDAAVNKIGSMQTMRKKNGTTVSASGASKMKKVGQQAGTAGTRVVSSGGKAAQKKTGNGKKR